MLRHLDISKTLSEKYLYNEEAAKDGYKDAIKKGIGYFTSFWTKYGLAHPNCQSLVIFMLKQVHYGGYTDRPQSEGVGNTKISIQIGGLEAK